jgi:signal peptidase I
LVSKGTVIYVALFALLVFSAYFVENDTRYVSGTSMLPTLEPGDLVVIQSVSVSDVHVGDIVVYSTPCSNAGESVIHRVVQTTGAGLITEGDNNPNTDQNLLIAVSPITQQCLEGKVVSVIPYVELLTYYELQVWGLPQWFNYLPAAVILMFVAILILSEKDKDEQESGAAKTVPPEANNGTQQ